MSAVFKHFSAVNDQITAQRQQKSGHNKPYSTNLLQMT